MVETLLDSYAETNRDDDGSIYAVWNANGSSNGQSFTTPNDGEIYKLTKCKFYLKKLNSPTGNIRAELYAHSGVYGTNSVPTGAILAYSDNVDSSTLTGAYQLVTFTFTGAQQIALTLNTHYCLCLTGISATINGGNLIYDGVESGTPTHGGNYFYYSAGWNPVAVDLCFYVYGELIPMATLTITAVDHVITSPTEGTHDYGEDSEVPVTATADVNYILHHWTLDGLNAGYLNPVTVTMNIDHTLTAVMVKYNSRAIDNVIQGFEK